AINVEPNLELPSISKTLSPCIDRHGILLYLPSGWLSERSEPGFRGATCETRIDERIVEAGRWRRPDVLRRPSPAVLQRSLAQGEARHPDTVHERFAIRTQKARWRRSEGCPSATGSAILLRAIAGVRRKSS